jgi:hypothetical protein
LFAIHKLCFERDQRSLEVCFILDAPVTAIEKCLPLKGQKWDEVLRNYWGSRHSSRQGKIELSATTPLLTSQLNPFGADFHAIFETKRLGHSSYCSGFATN